MLSREKLAELSVGALVKVYDGKELLCAMIFKIGYKNNVKWFMGEYVGKKKHIAERYPNNRFSFTEDHVRAIVSNDTRRKLLALYKATKIIKPICPCSNCLLKKMSDLESLVTPKGMPKICDMIDISSWIE